MISSNVRRSIGALVIVALASNVNWAAETPTPRPSTGKIGPAAASGSRPATASRSGTARGPLPDPTLLDGSTQAPEKKSEHGMIGEFELPGDENAKSGKVGGPQNQNPSQGGGGQSPPPAGMPQGGGGGKQSQQASQQNQQGGAQGGAQSAEGAQQAGAQQAGGAQGGGPQGQNAAGNPVAGGGDPGAQAQGIQVAELGGEAGGQQQPGGGPGEKPQQVGIGDSAMRIEPSAAAQGVVGAQQVAGQTQQHEKGTGSGGKGTGGAQGGNRVEKGRVIPAGL